MSAFGYGALTAVVLVVAVGAAGAIDATKYVPAEATVYRIDRTCSYTRITNDGPGNQTGSGVQQDCSATDEFKRIAAEAKRSMDVAGSAVVKVSYVAPQDGSARSGEVKFDGRDDQFYKLRAGDTLPIQVAKDNPDKIRFD